MAITDNEKHFLDLIAWSEGTSNNTLTRMNGYDVIVSGPAGPEIFTDFSDHPFAHRPPKVVRKGLGKSTASGRYQLLLRYWQSYSKMLGLLDFSPASQDAIAIQQLREVHALPLIEQGDIAGAINKACGLWASLPGNNYGQGAHALPVLLAQYEQISNEESV